MCTVAGSCTWSSARIPRPGAPAGHHPCPMRAREVRRERARELTIQHSSTANGADERQRGGPVSSYDRRLVIVVRADPVICGHSGEARNLAEVALTRGFTDVRLLTWPIATLQAAGLPLKPLDRLQPYSPGITVERPEPVGDYRVPDGRHLAGLTGRLVELLAEPVPTTCLAMYLVPHANVVIDAVRAAHTASFDP